MSPQAFADRYIGQQIGDNHDDYIGECISFVKRYAQEAQGVPNADAALYVKGDLAKNLFLDPITTTLQYYDKVVTPQAGDIAVYGNPNDGSYGDVAVVLNPSQVVGQLGFPLYYPVAIRNIGNPLGYLRRKGQGFMNQQQAERLAQQIGLISADPNWSDANWVADQARHIVADPDYAAALIKQEYDSQRWQQFNYKAVHYDNDVAAAAGNATPLKPGKYIVN